VGPEDLSRPYGIDQDTLPDMSTLRIPAPPHRSLEVRGKTPSEVAYQFSDLNPTVDYEIKAEFYN
jgi:hypothetical protein